MDQEEKKKRKNCKSVIEDHLNWVDWKGVLSKTKDFGGAVLGYKHLA